MTDSRPETSCNLSYLTRETRTLWGHHNTAAAQTGLGLLWQIWVSGLTWVMCRLISSGIVLTKQVSVKSEVLSKTKRLCVPCMFLCCAFFLFFFLHAHVKHMSVISQVLQWKWHQNPGGLALWDRLFDMISENREFSEKKGVVFVCCWLKKKKEPFYTNSGDELEGALPCFYWIFIIVAVSRGKCHDLCC